MQTVMQSHAALSTAITGKTRSFLPEWNALHTELEVFCRKGPGMHQKQQRLSHQGHILCIKGDQGAL